MAITLQQVAQSAGVSCMAASYALRDIGKTSVETRQRVKSAAADLGYLPSAAARSIRSRATGLIGILVANHPVIPFQATHHPALYEAVLGINHALDAEDYVSALVPFSDLTPLRPQFPRVFRERMLDAMIVLGGMPDDVREAVEQVVERVIWADGAVWESTCCLRRDEAGAGALAVAKAAAAGFNQLVMLQAEHGTEHYSTTERWRGAQEAARQLQLPLIALPFSEYSLNAAWQRIAPHLQPATALLAGAYHAQWLTSQCTFHALAPGRDFGLVGIESNEVLVRAVPQLSRVEFNRYEFGRRTGEMAAALLAGKAADCPSVLHPVTWHDGTTLDRPGTAPPPPRVPADTNRKRKEVPCSHRPFASLSPPS